MFFFCDAYVHGEMYDLLCLVLKSLHYCFHPHHQSSLLSSPSPQQNSLIAGDDAVVQKVGVGVVLGLFLSSLSCDEELIPFDYLQETLGYHLDLWETLDGEKRMFWGQESLPHCH